ncbi:MAG TPA: choice-of-anchor D domain-containing protein [Solirubrobacteraceae bacterium]|nr:choice-of-anchor D domain-containing protein [Solirubrobacteraceae bacterium]
MSVVLLGSGAGAARAAETPIGAHSMLQLNSPFEFMRTMFAEAAAMHAATIRLDVAPALVFHDPLQPPDFSGLDEVVALANAYHLRVVGNLTTIPWWISACETPRDISQMTLCGTDDLADYRAEITAIVRRADPAIRDWEIWNEPDLGSFFSGTPLQYAWMLRTAHDAIKAIDPAANVLLGGISGLSGQNWLAQTFAAAGPDAVHAFDIANIHERDKLDSLAGDVKTWRWFLAANGFTGPLWITEHGYASDPAFQYDPSYASGSGSQAAFLGASIPTLLDAGAAKVFVTERDNLSGQSASEGVLGGDVLDPPPADAQPIEKPAFATVRALADCYANLGRDCGGPAPAATPSSVAIPATRLRSFAVSYVTVSDPGTGPVQLGAVTIAGGSPNPVSVQSDGCSDQILEPDHPCKVALRFAPVSGGAVAATLLLPSDAGVLNVPVAAVAPSVSSLSSPQIMRPAFRTIDGADGVGHTQRLIMTLSNPLSTPVRLTDGSLSGANARQFAIRPNDCARVQLAPGGRCLVYVLFEPSRAGTASATLTLHGDGNPLEVALRAIAFALPSVTSLTATGSSLCFAPGARNRVLIATDQSATVHWRLASQPHAAPRRCRGSVAGSSGSGRTSASGRAPARAQRSRGVGKRRFTANVALPVGGRRGLWPGTYRLTATASDAHGAGRSRSVLLTVTR